MLHNVALGIPTFAAITLFHGTIAFHGIPCEIAAHRNHRLQEATRSDHPNYLAIVRKILLRMSTWLNYLSPFS